MRIEMPYPNALLKMWLFADIDSVRFSLGFVRLDFANSRIEATNGKIAVRHRVAFSDDFANRPAVLLYRTDLKRVARYFKDTDCRRLKLVNDGDRWYAEGEDVSFVLRTENGRWPDTDLCFSKKPERAVSLNLSAELLRDLCVALQLDGDTPLNFSIPLDGSTMVTVRRGEVVEAVVQVMSDCKSASPIAIHSEPMAATKAGA